jgi:transcription antitermination protein NusB
MGARSKARKRAVDLLFEADARGVDAVTLLADRVGSPDVAPINDYTVDLVEGVVARREEIDRLIEEHAEGWTLQRMPAVDRAVLRLGIYELLWMPDVPDAVAIDEAVELAKLLSTDDSPRFVNGILAQLLRESTP